MPPESLWYTVFMRPMILAILTGMLLVSVPPLLAAPVPAGASSWSLTAVGDIMLDRNVWVKIKAHGKSYPFEKITDQLRGSDIVLANLEGPFTNSAKHAVSGGALSFNFDPSMAPVLKRAGLTTLSLANNHTLNQGRKGLNGTRATLKKNGLDYFGDPRNGTNYHLTKTVNGERVTFLGYDNLDGKITQVITDIKNAHRKGEYVIVVPHWGAEYQLGVQPKLQAQAKQLIDAGADMVLGGHPHVVEPFEIYKGKFIAYSLGNFIFDQYFSADTQQGLMLKLAFSSSTITVNVIPLISVRSQIAVATGTVKTNLLNRLSNNSVVSTPVRNGIRKGIFTIAK